MNEKQLRDGEIRAAFEARSEVAPSANLAARISTTARRTRQRRALDWLPDFPARNGPRLLWAAVISAISLGLVGILIVGGQRDDRLSVVPSATASVVPSATASVVPSSTTSPSPSPSATTEPTPNARPPLATDSVAVTADDRLRVRSAPGVGAASLRREPLLPKSTKLFVVAGPVVADGYDWYQVQPFDQSLPFGWVAAADHDGTPWIEPGVLTCASALTLQPSDLAALTPLGALACYGSSELTVIGNVHCEVADVDRSFSGPDWLRSDVYCELDLEDGTTMEFHNGGFALGLPTTGRAELAGHFDDPQAGSCVHGVEGTAPDPASVILSCRTQFVAMDMRSP